MILNNIKKDLFFNTFVILIILLSILGLYKRVFLDKNFTLESTEEVIEETEEVVGE